MASVLPRSVGLIASRVVANRVNFQPTTGARLTADVDELPKTGVSDFVRRLAEANQVVYERTLLDDWAYAVNERRP